MRRETFDTPGPLELNVRVPSGDVDLETAEGDERAAARGRAIVERFIGLTCGNGICAAANPTETGNAATARKVVRKRKGIGIDLHLECLQLLEQGVDMRNLRRRTQAPRL